MRKYRFVDGIEIISLKAIIKQNSKGSSLKQNYMKYDLMRPLKSL